MFNVLVLFPLFDPLIEDESIRQRFNDVYIPFIRDLILFIVCIASFYFQPKIKEDIVESNERLDIGEKANDCADKYSHLNTQIFKKKLHEASLFLIVDFWLTIVVSLIFVVFVIYRFFDC